MTVINSNKNILTRGVTIHDIDEWNHAPRLSHYLSPETVLELNELLENKSQTVVLILEKFFRPSLGVLVPAI